MLRPMSVRISSDGRDGLYQGNRSGFGTISTSQRRLTLKDLWNQYTSTQAYAKSIDTIHQVE